MDRYEVYKLRDRLNSLINHLKPLKEYGLENFISSFEQEESFLRCAEYAETLQAWCRAEKDKELMIECCKLDRYFLSYVSSTFPRYSNIRECYEHLYDIHVLALQEVFGITQNDAEHDEYYIKPDGTCWDCNNTREVLRIEKHDAERMDSEPRNSWSKNKTVPQQAEPKNQLKKVELPEGLDTPEAKKYWSKAMEMGFINDDYTFNGTVKEMAYFAGLMADTLKLKNKWAPFQRLFKVTTLAQQNWKNKEIFGSAGKRQTQIDEIFK